MSREANLAANERLGELVNTGDLDALGEVFADDVVDHDPAPEQGPGVDGFKDFFTAMRTGFPDLKVAPATVVADDEQVAMAYTITGTHEGEFQGIEPTGKRIEARGVQVARFRDGKIVERWGSSDELGLVGQLGMEPQPAQS
jgi:steroid delta-isomerase-like uncharacterized protein